MTGGTSRPTQAEDALVRSYASLFEGLLPGISGSAHFNAQLRPVGGTGSLNDLRDASTWLRDCGWLQQRGARKPIEREAVNGRHQLAFPLLNSEGRLLWAVGIDLTTATKRRLGDHLIDKVAQRLRPAFECLQRERSLVPAAETTTVTDATERTADLEWLFHVSADLKRSDGEWLSLQHLLASACTRIEATLGSLSVPDKNISLIQAIDTTAAAPIARSLPQLQPHLLAWTVRKKEVLLVNEPSSHLRALVPARLLIVPVLAPSGRVVGLLAFFRGLEMDPFTERHRYLASHLARQIALIVESQSDLATGLPTRAALEHSVEQRCQQTQAHRSLVYIDIDGLHVCNEKHGFELGDELIMRIADLLTSKLVPAESLVGRLSGDKFAVMLENCEPQAALGFTQKLQQAASKIVIGPAEDTFDVSLSCGVATVVDVPKGFARALACSEIACKAAKDRGRNRTELYANDDISMMRRRGDMILVGQLREAIRKEKLILHAQPIVRLDRERSSAGFEVLLRWRDPTGEIVAPGAFMSAAQRYQLMPQIDRYVVRHTLAQLAPYRGLLMEMKATASINISGQSLSDESFIEYLLNELHVSNVPPGLVTCEITEQTAVACLAKSVELMHRLRRAGCKVALDDFGTGASNFTYLQSLPATRIKIDGSFVKDILTNARCVSMVKSLVGLAREFQMDCVAEYVETDALARKLETLGVDHAQGYAFGRPEPLEELLKRMQGAESERLRAYWLEV
jgi:diguanylate cyclase (GGDEF)-like protein